MSETTYSTEECSLDFLENDRIRSNAYVAFFIQKTQADANRFIYGIQGNGLSPSNTDDSVIRNAPAAACVPSRNARPAGL